MLNLRSHLLKKMFSSYILLLVLPCLVFSGLYLIATQEYFKGERLRLEQNALQQSCQDIQTNIDTCESVYYQIQQHSNFLRFLDGGYWTEAQQLELYVKELYTMFTYAKSYSPYVEKVQVFAFHPDLVLFDDYVKDISDISDYELNRALDSGYWIYREDNKLVYRRSLRSTTYSSVVGILEMTCRTELITERLLTFSNSIGREVYVSMGDTCYVVAENGLLPCKNLHPKSTMIQRELPFLSMQVSIDQMSDQWDNLGISNVLTMTALVAFLVICLLSILYFLSVSRLSSRIVDFSKHISQISGGVPTPYHDNGKDEFSLLVENFNQMLEKNNQLVDQIELEQLRRNEMAYKMLQAQIDPHFLYNALESIRMLAEMEDQQEISDMIFSLSRLMRYIFSTNTQSVSLLSELDLVEQYLKIQKMRLRDKLHYQISFPEELKEVAVPQFTIQPLVENAIKYGLIDPAQALSIKINVKKENSTLYIRVENNGKSLEEQRIDKINSVLEEGGSLSSLSSGTGMGLDSVNTRMRYLYPKSFRMRLKNPEQGTGLLVILSWRPEKDGFRE